LSAFALYQREQAETWEHMALSRARVVAGEQSLAAEIKAVVDATLRTERDAGELARDALEMRALIGKEKGDSDAWDLKLVSGGLLDIEFVAQVLMLAHGREHPEILDVSTRAALAACGRSGLLSTEDAGALAEAHHLYGAATQLMRLAVAGPFDPAAAATGVKRRIANAAGLADFSMLSAAVEDARAAVRPIFTTVLS
jgi:glutamate-ammonia-ligase adenylyltransferase